MASRKRENRQRFDVLENQELDNAHQSPVPATALSPIFAQPMAAEALSSSPPTGPRSQVQDILPPRGADLQQQRESPDQVKTLDQPLTFETLYEEFCATYAAYKGNIKHFTSLVNDIDHSRSPLHPFLWDDFVIRNKTDWVPYNMECIENGERPLGYETYYTTRITKPLYTESVLTADRLQLLLRSGENR